MKDKMFRIFSSSIKIKVKGRNINNFIKRLIKNNINIRRVIPISYKEVDLIIDYNDLEEVVKYKTIYDIKIIKYYGKLKVLKLLKKNIFIISFLILGLIIIYILSNVIFDIEIVHSNSNIIKLIEEELYDHDVRKYSFVKSYDEIEKIENEILKDNKDNLEWLEIIREGTKYIVRVEERIINKEIDDSKIYNIVAGKNAVIKTIEAESGEKVKNINTYVKKGEIIISSDITLPNNEKKLSTASGRVTGEVWYTIDIEYPYYYNEIKYTGNKKKVLVFDILNKKLSLFDFNKYKSFDKDTKIIFKNSFMPISLVYEYQYETNVINNIYTYDEAIDKAIELAKKKLLDKYKNIIGISNIVIIKEEDLGEKVYLSLFVTSIEDITEYIEVTEEDNIK